MTEPPNTEWSVEDERALNNEPNTEALLATVQEARDWLRNWTAREEAERGTRRKIEKFHRWADALDTIASELRRKYDEGYDEGQADVWEAIVCSVCGWNHDRDESAACEGCEPVTFREWRDAIASELERLRQINSDVVDVNTEACNRADAAEAELERVRAELREWQTSIATETLQARLDRAVGALREIEDTEWGDAAHEVNGPNDFARAALAEIKECW